MYRKYKHTLAYIFIYLYEYGCTYSIYSNCLAFYLYISSLVTRARFLQLKFTKNTDPYSGLARNISVVCRDKLQTKWLLQIHLKDQKLITCKADLISYFGTSVCIQWHTAFAEVALDIKNVCVVKVLASCLVGVWKEVSATSVLPGKKSTYAVKDRASRSKSLVLQHDIRNGLPTLFLQDDKTLHIRALSNSLIQATFVKGSSEKDSTLAFITANIHYHDILPRLLAGSSERIFPARQHVVLLDDIDPLYGLHNFSLTLELRTFFKILLGQSYSDLHCELDTERKKVSTMLRNGIRFFNIPVISRKSGHVSLDLPDDCANVNFPWTTGSLSNSIANLVICDVTLKDESNSIYWTSSNITKIEDVPFLTFKDAAIDYRYEGPYFRFQTGDNSVSLHADLVRSGSKMILIKLDVSLAVENLNKWFGTKY